MSFLATDTAELVSLLLALAVGLIIGLERGWQGQDDEAGEVRGDGRTEGRNVGGIRTFALVGLLGGITVLVANQTHAVVLAAGLLVLGALLVGAYRVTSAQSGDYGTTTEVALVLTFMLGALVVTGHRLEAVSAAVLTAALLGFKAEIHSTLAKLDRRELHSSLQLLVIALVVIPLLPDQGMGPWNSLNPRMLGLLVMLIAGIGFVGYFAIRMIGARAGLLITAVLGGLTSSTAVTVAFARLARRSGRNQALLGVGIALACATMAPRLLIEVAAVNQALVPIVLPGLAALAAVPLAAALWVARRYAHHADTSDLGINNPLELGQALIIGAVLAAVFVLSHGAEAWLGAEGVYGLALLSGVADVDAISLALAKQAHGDLEADVAGQAIVLSALSNTLFKAGFAAVIGGLQLARWATSILLLALLAGATTLLFF
jgi:uncharacterized membrane protein (DUF4010 family)